MKKDVNNYIHANDLENFIHNFKHDWNKRIAVCCIFIPIIIVLLIIGVFSFPLNKYHTTPGTVVGDSVRYVRNTIKYVALQDLGIREEDVSEGQEISIFLDSSDNVIGGKIYSSFQGNFSLTCIILAAFLIIPPAIIRTHGEGRFDTYELLHNLYQVYISKDKVYLCRWMGDEPGSLQDAEEHRFDKGEILSLIKVCKSKRYKNLAKMEVQVFDELHCKQEIRRRIWITSNMYDVMMNNFTCENKNI